MSAIGSATAASMVADESADLDHRVCHRPVYSRQLVGQIIRLLLAQMTD